ncbi:uncharacterized protein L203_104637 [Cryptococcus depauperatus CBS 7841]|uniref:Uncharacterized protein n=1 Tax=Cryptococcus depauperatus CBS 7841 TaxID=1295531 RepID=A0A1E3ILH0_9TREE|nr:hypothetical protein L203_02159 [Cryptococcus depauperatus CBS 7841]
MSCLTRPAPLRSFMPVMRFFVPRIRKFTTSPSPPSERDPSHPHLWYHPGSSFISLSFLPNKPAIQGSKTILGYLPLGEATIDDFKEEPKFLKVLEEAIKSGISQGKATTVEFEAETRPTDGWIHINDERAIPPAGRIGETEDIIGSVYVQQGKIVADTYSSLPTYRLVTPNGVLTLPKGLDQHLISVLEGIDAEERKTDSVN